MHNKYEAGLIYIHIRDRDNRRQHRQFTILLRNLQARIHPRNTRGRSAGRQPAPSSSPRGSARDLAVKRSEEPVAAFARRRFRRKIRPQRAPARPIHSADDARAWLCMPRLATAQAGPVASAGKTRLLGRCWEASAVLSAGPLAFLAARTASKPVGGAAAGKQ
jgi:hypothetical protein